MAVPVARVHLKVAHAALPALLPTPPRCKTLTLVPTTPYVAAVLPKPLTRPSRADADERWDARKIKPAGAEPSATSPASGLRRPADGVFRSIAGHGSPHSQRKNATSPPPMSGRADAVERWDAHKKAARPASSPSSPGTSSLASSSKLPISRATSSDERWDVHKKRRPAQTDQRLDDGESSSNGISDNDDTEEEEIVWKPRAMYAGPGFVVAAPKPSMLPTPTAFLVAVA